MSEQELIQSGISALQANEKQRATAIFAQVVQQNPQSERGWFLLGTSVDDATKRKYCFQRVLSLNPNNQDAQRQLALLSQPQPVTPPSTFTAPKEPITQKTPAFIEQTDSFEQFRSETPQPISQPLPKKPAPKKKKNDNVIIIVSVISGLCILGVTAIAGFMILNSRTTQQSTAPVPQVSTATMPALVTNPTTEVGTLTAPVQLPTAQPTLPYTPAFEETPCPFEAPEGARVTCGYAIVPENRTTNSGRSLRLAVAIFHSTSSNPAPDPVVFLQGGPGAEANQLSAELYDILVQPFLSERDYITFDQRGTGFSEPKMVCDELDKIQRQDIYGGLGYDTRELAYQNAVQDCSGFLQSQGFDLTAYSTVESAADLRDIVKLLGYEKVNLYGASYGTRLALVTMRNHPEIVRSAILDSVVPVESNLLLEYPQANESALNQMFISCASDPDCGAAYPDLEKTFRDLITQLDANPVTLTTSAYPVGTVTDTMDGAYLYSVITRLLKTSQFINTAPQTLYRVRDGDYTTLLLAQLSLPFEFDDISQGLYISMMCREHVLSTTEDALNEAAAQLGTKSSIFRPFYGNFGKTISACKTWGAEGPDLGETDAVISDIPALVIEGSFDPSTPPYFGKQVAAELPNSYYFEFSNSGHVPTSGDTNGCAETIVKGFLNSPLTQPDGSCLNSLPKTKFLISYTGEPALPLKTETFDGITLKVPADWSIDSEGDLYRGNSAFDITQAAVLRSSITIQDLTTALSSMAFFLAFDNSPIPTGTREANGHTWTLYSTTSRKYPVDIAVSNPNSKGSSIFIVLYSHIDEHDAMYRTVFLPMVDSAR